ncbi:MAG: hypothetical protein ACYDHX_15745 [Methanothrix sp.]
MTYGISINHPAIVSQNPALRKATKPEGMSHLISARRAFRPPRARVRVQTDGPAWRTAPLPEIPRGSGGTL